MQLDYSEVATRNAKSTSREELGPRQEGNSNKEEISSENRLLREESYSKKKTSFREEVVQRRKTRSTGT